MCGVLENGILGITSYNVPELTVQFKETRDPEQAGICLISKQGVLSEQKKD